MATTTSSGTKEVVFEWQGKDRNGKIVRGEIRAMGENQVQASLRRQGILPTKIKKRRMSSGKRITPKDLAIFTRQLATMMKAGVPLLQSFDIVGRGNANASVAKLLNDIRMDVETGTSLNAAFRKFPLYLTTLLQPGGAVKQPVSWTSCWTAWRFTWRKQRPSNPKSNRH
jgi:type IV pilus assembly protein PilC